MRKRFLLMVSGLLVFLLLHGQCPDRDSLRAEVIELGDFSKLPVKERLSKLMVLLKREEICRDPYDSVHAMLLRKIGRLYFGQGDFLSAVRYYQQSLKMIKDNIYKSSVNPRDQIGLYYWLSTIYDSLNNYQQYMMASDSCYNLAIRFKASSDISFVRNMYSRLQHDYDIGDYQRCIDNAVICEKLSREYAKSSKQAYPLGMSHVSSSLGWRVKSLLRIKDYGTAKVVLANKLEEYKRAGLKDYVGLIYGELAEWQIGKGNFDSALSYYNQAYRYIKTSGSDLNKTQTLKDIGYNIYFAHDKNYEKAMVCYREALLYSGTARQTDPELKMESLNILSNIAKIWTLRKNYDSAFRYFQLAFSMISPGINAENLSQIPLDILAGNGKIEYVLSLMTDQADAYLKKYQDKKDPAALPAAVRDYKATDSLLERIKNQQTEVSSKLFWRQDMHGMYEHAVESAYLSHDPVIAFYFFERSRAVILNDQITERHWQSEQEIMEQTQLRRAIQNLEKKLAVVDNLAGSGIEWQNELLEKRRRMDSLSTLIRKKHPLYYQRYLDSAHITLEDTRKTILKDHQGLLELFEGDSSIYALFVTPDQAHFKKIDKKDFDSCTKLCNDMLANSDLLNSRMPDFARTANRLYQLIFEKTAVPAGRIIISPDGPYFPFEALVTDDSKPMSPKYFLQDHAVSYAYSARYLMNDFGDHSKDTAEDFLGMAPVSFHSGKSLPNLAGSDISLNQIGAYFNHPEKLTGPYASKTRFMDEFSKYRIIQLYTHSSDHSERNEPVIYFADSALYLSELIPERKPLAQLVVLSACETGNGQVNRGEGIFSFNRAFAAIGIPTSIINLWEVDDRTTYRLTEIFYKYLTEGMPSDLALQRAKLEFIQTGSRLESLPFYWAAAVVAGKTDTVTEKKSRKWIYYSALAGFGILSLLTWAIWKKRKN